MRARRGRQAHPAVLLAVGAILGAVLGWAGAPWVATRLGSPVSLDTTEWNLLVPGHDEGLADSGVTSGTGVVDGMLLLALRSFGRADMLIPRDPRPVARLDVEFGRGSGSVIVNIRGAAGAIARPIEVTPDAFRVHPVETWTAHARSGVVSLTVRGGVAAVNGVEASAASPGTVELSPGTASARIRRVFIEAVDGSVILDRTFAPAPVSAVVHGYAAGLGVLLGVAIATLIGAGRSRVAGGVLALVALTPAVIAVNLHYPAWRAVCNRLYLLHTPAAALRSGAFAVALLPLIALALLRSGWLILPRRPRAELPWPALFAVVVVADIVASRELSGWQILFALPGLAFCGAPVWMARSAGLSPLAVLMRDLPALIAISAGTWSVGFLPAIAWRMLCIVVDAPTFANRAARAGTDAFFLHLLALPVAAEAALRSTYLAEGWTPAALEGATLGSSPSDAREFAPYWTSSCGAVPPARTVYAFGGSSTGGAYQFRGEPEAFFPAKLLPLLCGSVPEGVGIAMRNYGDSGRDSFDVAHRAAELYAADAPAVTIVYLGVNDLLTLDAPITRKQRAAKLASRGAAVSGLDAISSASRLITGLSLLVRPPPATPQMVAAVPLADAEENLRNVIALTTAAGARVVLVTEFAQTMVAGHLDGYWAMEERLSRELPGVDFLDLYAAFAGIPIDVLLADRNHLTREGGDRVAALLTPLVAPALVAGSSASWGGASPSLPAPQQTPP